MKDKRNYTKETVLEALKEITILFTYRIQDIEFIIIIRSLLIFSKF